MPQRSETPVVFEPEYLEGFREIYEEKIVFNQTLGLKLTSIVPNVVTAVLASYRGYDTLGETTVVFTAGAGVVALLRRRRKHRKA